MLRGPDCDDLRGDVNPNTPEVLGDLRDKLWQHIKKPACLIQVRVPMVASPLFFRPLELAYLRGKSLAGHGFRFIYTTDTPPAGKGKAKAAPDD